MADKLNKFKTNFLQKQRYEVVPTEVEPVRAWEQPQRKKSSRCCGGCGCCLLVTLAVIAGFFFILFTGTYIWIRHQVIRFTVPSRDYPQPPLVDESTSHLDEDQLVESFDKAKLFWDTLAAGGVPEEDLIISETELNSAIANSDYMRGHARVTISDHRALFEYALPTDGLPGGHHRYFMGSFKVWLISDTGHFLVTMTPKHAISGLKFDTILNADMLVYSRNAGQPAVAVIGGHFLNEVQASHSYAYALMFQSYALQCTDDMPDYENCQLVVRVLTGIESIAFEEGLLVIKPRRDADAAATEGNNRELQDNDIADTPMVWMMARRVLHTLMA